MNTHVDFETAKLLKEKGFDDPCYAYYNVKDVSYHLFSDKLQDPSCNSDITPHDFIDCTAPTVDDVKWWLYEKHGIWIEVRKYVRNGLRCFSPYIDNTPIKEDVFFNDYDSPTEAYLEAIQHTLNNLI